MTNDNQKPAVVRVVRPEIETYYYQLLERQMHETISIPHGMGAHPEDIMVHLEKLVSGVIEAIVRSTRDGLTRDKIVDTLGVQLKARLLDLERLHQMDQLKNTEEPESRQ